MLHLLVGGVCNNNCLFCMEADRKARAAHARSQSHADVYAMIDTFPDTDGILFTSGEPTFNPNLFRYIRRARQRGFAEIGIITNGRRLAYPHYARRLLDLGINHVTVSIHGHTAKLHDGLTRTPGSFAQTCAGLRNLCLLKISRQFELRTSTVVSRRNLPHLQAIHRFLASNSPIDLMVMNVMMARGRGARYLESLMPRYRDVVRGVNRLCASLDSQELGRLRVEDIPACLASRLHRAVRGDLEHYRQYEAVGSTGLSEVVVRGSGRERGPEGAAREGETPASGSRDAARLAEKVSAPGSDPLPDPSTPASGAGTGGTAERDGGDRVRKALMEQLERRTSLPDLEADGSYYITDRVLKDALLRVKGKACARCSHEGPCPGVWQPYVERFGWDEFEPF